MNWKFWKKTDISSEQSEHFADAGKMQKQIINQEPDTIPQDSPRYINNFYLEEFSALKPDDLANYIIWATSGIPAFMYLLYEVIRQRDMRIATPLMRRKFACLDEKYVIECEWKEGKQFAENVLKGLGSKLFRFFTQCVEANYQGLKRFEINYDIDKGKVIARDIIAVSNYLYLYNQRTNKLDFIDITQTDALKIMSEGIQSTYDRSDFAKLSKVKVADEKILDVYGLDGDNRNPFLNGHTIGVIIGYFFKGYNVKDMNKFIERFAAPVVDAQYDGINPQAKSDMEKAIKILKSFGYLIRPMGSNITYLNDNQKGTAAQIFLNAIKYWDSTFTLRILGEEETTQMGNKGSLAALQIKKVVSDDIMVADLKVITFAVNELLKRLCDYNFSNIPDYPEIKFIKVKTLEEQKTQSEIAKNVSGIGYKPTKEYVEENLEIPVEDSPDPDPVDPPADPPAKDPEDVKSKKVKASEKYSMKEITDEYLQDLFDATNEELKQEVKEAE